MIDENSVKSKPKTRKRIGRLPTLGNQALSFPKLLKRLLRSHCTKIHETKTSLHVAKCQRAFIPFTRNSISNQKFMAAILLIEQNSSANSILNAHHEHFQNKNEWILNLKHISAKFRVIKEAEINGRFQSFILVCIQFDFFHK